VTEVELKFEVTPGDLKSLEGHPVMAGPAQKISLATAYYDTPAGDLRAAGLSLRVRRQAGRFTQTLKRTRSADLFDRDEWEGETSRFAPDLTLLEDTPVADLLAAHGPALRQQFTLKVERAMRLHRVDGAEIEIVIDRGEVRAGDAKEALLELELELKSGEAQQLYALAEDLLETAPIRLSFDTKSDRGHRLVSGEAGDARKAEALALTPGMSTEIAFRCIARSCLVQLAANGQALRLGRRPEALHQARIALRRLRSALTVFRPILRDEAFPFVRHELKWAADQLDLARDLDVFVDRVAHGHGDREAARFLGRLRQARDRAYDHGLEALDSPRYAKLLLKTALWIEDGPWIHDDSAEAQAALEEPVVTFAARVLEDRSRKVRRTGKALRTLDPVVRHHLRIEAKKLRYAAEFFEKAFPHADKRRRRYIDALKALQDELGALNDIAVAPVIARHGVFGHGATDLAFTAGQIVGELRQGEHKLIDRTAKAFDAFRKARPFWEEAGKEA
jgi:triphosphatase